MISTYSELSCEQEECFKVYEYGDFGQDIAMHIRRHARLEGWGRVKNSENNMLDLCPDCFKRYCAIGKLRKVMRKRIDAKKK